MTVRITPDTAGTLGLDHTAGVDGSVSATTGPTERFEKSTVVGVVEADDSCGQALVDATNTVDLGVVYFDQRPL